MTGSLSAPWWVEISDNGRSGVVVYHEGVNTISCYWEFCGGDTVASIFIGDISEWNTCYPWAVGRRMDVLMRIAAEVVRQKAPTCSALIEDQLGFISIK